MTAGKVTLRRFALVRSEDVSGTSGTGVVAEGVEFSNGQIVIHWISQLDSVNVYANAKVLEQLHGHDGRTIVRWIDATGAVECPTTGSTK
jgi:hypothetical protein